MPGSLRVEQPDWTSADLDRWSDVVRREVQLGCEKALIIAHSFGCLATIDVLQSGCPRIGAALLVAPADPKHFGIPDTRLAGRLSVPAILVASHNDPWMTLERATFWSQRLGCWLFDAGHAGHINVASGMAHGPTFLIWWLHWPALRDPMFGLCRRLPKVGSRYSTITHKQCRNSSFGRRYGGRT